MRNALIPLALAAIIATGCRPYIEPVLKDGQRVPPRGDQAVEQARAGIGAERELMAAEAGDVRAAALAACVEERCAALARGEVALGMTEIEVLGATRSTERGWDRRGGTGTLVLTGRLDAPAPRDAVGEIAFVSLDGGVVRTITYRESQGFRTVSSPADATRAGVAAARAEALIGEGDEFAAFGDFTAALARYDRADVIRPNDPETTYRIATSLDKLLRPYEAAIRYRLFLHQLEIEKIEARGRAAGYMADAIAQARQRLIIIERQ